MTASKTTIPSDPAAREAAEEAYADLVNLYPDNEGYLRQYAELLIASEKAATATEILSRLHKVLEKKSPQKAAELSKEFPQIGRVVQDDNSINDDSSIGHALRDHFGFLWLTIHKKKIKEGEYLYRNGEYADTLYIILSGEIASFIINDQGQHIILNLIGKNDIAGESCFLKPGKRKTDMVANKDSVVVKLPRKKLEIFLKENSDAELDLHNKAGFRRMVHFLSVGSLLQSLPLNIRQHLAKESTLARFPSKTRIRKSGDKSNTIDSLIEGKACYMVKDSKGKYHKLANINIGELMGDASAIRDSSYPADIVALNDVQMVHIPFNVFKNVVEAQPSLKEKLFQSVESQRLQIMEQVTKISLATSP